MGGCSAGNCFNHSRNNFRMFEFPKDPKRRQKWIINCGRDGWAPGRKAQLCSVHFDETQFELHRQDGWKKLKPNAIPTIFPDPVDKQKVKKRKIEKRKRVSSEEPRTSSQEESTGKQSLKIRLKRCNSKYKTVQKKKKISENSSENLKETPSNASQNCQKENVSPRSRKTRSPKIKYVESDSDTELEELDNESENEKIKESLKRENEKMIESLKHENETMKQEIEEFEKHNKMMSSVIVELEKHNNSMALKLTELDKDNKVMAKKISDLEKLNEDLKSKLKNSLSEEQIARMEKMRNLGQIEIYIPALK